MKINIQVLLIVMTVITMSSCKKEETVPAKVEELVPMTVVFENKVGDKDLVLNDETYTNANGDEYTVSMFNYYVSNIVLTRKDGSEYVYPKDSSYFLVKERLPETQKIKLNVPKDEYTGIRFVLGVDSLKSVSPTDERIGVLALDNPEVMFWEWKSGYIFMKMEGNAPKSEQPGNKIFFHIGLFGGFNKNIPKESTLSINNLKTINVPFGSSTAMPSKDSNTMVHIAADVNKLFEGDETVSFAEYSYVMVRRYSEKIANNYANGFKLLEVHN